MKRTSGDKPKKGPWRITFDTNPDTCNLNCIMCEEHSPYSIKQVLRRKNRLKKRVMPFSVIERTVNEAVPYGLREIIPSTMGEPLLYDDFDGIVYLCMKNGLSLNLTTNGTFPHLGVKVWAEKIAPIASDVKISINGATMETHEAIMKGSNFDATVDNIREFIAVRDSVRQNTGHYCTVTMQMTFLESNASELADMTRLALSLGVDRIKGHHLWDHFEEIKGLSMRRNSEVIQRWNDSVREAEAIASGVSSQSRKRIKLDNIYTLSDSAKTDLAPGGDCPFLCKEAWISAEGRFDPCCAPDEQRRTLGEFGSLNISSFMEIWYGHKYRTLVKDYPLKALCISCNMRKPAGA